MKNLKLLNHAVRCLICLLVSLLATQAWAFDSGSTGTDGAFAPSINTTVTIPSDGILNYTTFNIPAGVTIKYAPNTTNTPVYILVQGDAIIDGTIDISGLDGDVLGSLPPGGFAGGVPQLINGGGGRGPGGSGGAGGGTSGNGASYRTSGVLRTTTNGSNVGPVYGSAALQPLIGGSGGGATDITSSQPGNRGGSGAGAMLLAVSGTLTFDGQILATGGNGAPSTPVTSQGAGAGSGGAVRIVATNLSGAGSIDISGGTGGDGASGNGGNAGRGRARLEADTFAFTGTVTLNDFATSTPQPVFAANLPTILITSVAGSAVPANPTGENDVVLPSTIVNPVTVDFAASGVPIGSTVELTVTPIFGAVTSVTSSALAGIVDASTASATATLPSGSSILVASVSFTTTTATAEMLSPYANGEMVAKVELRSTLGSGTSSMTLTTVSGKVFEVPGNVAKSLM